MPKNNIGGFFFSLVAEIDKASFEASNRLVDGLGNSFNKLIGSATNAANAIANTTLDTAKMGDSAYKMSEAWGIAVDALNLWRATAKITTSDAKSLDSALGKLADVKNGLKFGDGFNAFSEQLAKLGMGYGDLDTLDPDKQLEAIINHALTQSTLNKAETAKVLEGLLGEGASQLYIKLSDKGVTNVGQYQQSEVIPHVFTNNEDFLNLAGFQEQVNIFDQSIDSLKTLFGSTLAKNLTDPLTRLNDWLVAHGDEIKDAMDKLGTALANTITEMGKTGATAGSVVLAGRDYIDFLTADTPEAKQAALGKLNKAVDSWRNPGKNAGLLANGISFIVNGIDKIENSVERNKILGQDINYIYKLYKESNKGKKQASKLKYSSLSETEQLVVDDYIAQGGKGHLNYIEMQDGIMRPDGTVAKVAPDDWVFAARNIGDMARAFFIPQNYNSVSAPSEYTINQTFNISGVNDIPQVLKQQAYQGTQDAMLQMMEQSSRRLQLMSGTR